eukprot:GHVQ01036767.1.p1 GENE.GHVQ01036767.1~~GHVQ01036767.1.p1  ORF type:complete len:634 (+),score=53.16 GHVQ01036767.1:56-1957(+)
MSHPTCQLVSGYVFIPCIILFCKHTRPPCIVAIPLNCYNHRSYVQFRVPHVPDSMAHQSTANDSVLHVFFHCHPLAFPIASFLHSADVRAVVIATAHTDCASSFAAYAYLALCLRCDKPQTPPSLLSSDGAEAKDSLLTTRAAYVDYVHSQFCHNCAKHGSDETQLSRHGCKGPHLMLCKACSSDLLPYSMEMKAKILEITKYNIPRFNSHGLSFDRELIRESGVLCRGSICFDERSACLFLQVSHGGSLIIRDRWMALQRANGTVYNALLHSIRTDFSSRLIESHGSLFFDRCLRPLFECAQKDQEQLFMLLEREELCVEKLRLLHRRIRQAVNVKPEDRGVCRCIDLHSEPAESALSQRRDSVSIKQEAGEKNKVLLISKSETTFENTASLLLCELGASKISEDSNISVVCRTHKTAEQYQQLLLLSIYMNYKAFLLCLQRTNSLRVFELCKSVVTIMVDDMSWLCKHPGLKFVWHLISHWLSCRLFGLPGGHELDEPAMVRMFCFGIRQVLLKENRRSYFDRHAVVKVTPANIYWGRERRTDIEVALLLPYVRGSKMHFSTTGTCGACALNSYKQGQCGSVKCPENKKRHRLKIELKVEPSAKRESITSVDKMHGITSGSGSGSGMTTSR